MIVVLGGFLLLAALPTASAEDTGVAEDPECQATVDLEEEEVILRFGGCAALVQKKVDEREAQLREGAQEQCDWVFGNPVLHRSCPVETTFEHTL